MEVKEVFKLKKQLAHDIQCLLNKFKSDIDMPNATVLIVNPDYDDMGGQTSVLYVKVTI